jgi:antitoxin ParD1/3/4
MADNEQMTITLPSELAAMVEGFVASGDYVSSSDLIGEALRDWKSRNSTRLRELQSLRADIDKGLVDIAEGRVRNVDRARIVARGRQLSPGRTSSG